jgi:hypothetical protein
MLAPFHASVDLVNMSADRIIPSGKPIAKPLSVCLGGGICEFSEDSATHAGQIAQNDVRSGAEKKGTGPFCRNGP